MKAKSALSLAVVAGVAASATAGNTPANRDIVPLRKAGVMYINMETGERSLTLYDQGDIPEVDINNSSAVLFDYWMSVDENPCWEDARADGFGWNSDATGDCAAGFCDPIIGFDFGDMPFDSKITGIIINTAVLANEYDADGDPTNSDTTDLDTVMVYFDALSEGNRTSIAPPTAAVRIEYIPGNIFDVPNGFSDYDLIADFGSGHFEMGDSDGADLGTLNMSGAAGGWDLSALIAVCTLTTTTTTTGGITSQHCVGTTITANPNADGLADIQYMQYYAQHGTDDKVTADSTFIGLGTPEGTVAFDTYTDTTTTTTTTISGQTNIITITVTITDTTLTADPLPQGQSAFESFGIGMLGVGGDATSVDWSVGGCCFWFGGVDCAGFLAQLDDSNPPSTDLNGTWYNFGPYAQDGAAFLSNQPFGFDCSEIDLDGDTFITGGDISTFIGFFLSGNIAADMNGDGFLDGGDISLFVQLFLSCTG